MERTEMSKYINADEQERIMQKNEMIESNDWVEIVRCKDCKYSDDDIVGRICRKGAWLECVVTDDFYCGFGERKDNDK